ncbi:MAG: HAMP domain-containing protein [Betaproteobacteria bacterium]|nr:HAMP domain-containing protein [Betaproteobacteria bacterium]
MRLLPQSLLARSVLLISFILIASQVAWIQFYRMSSAQSQSAQAASTVVRVLKTVSTALESMPASSRRKFSERLPLQQNIRLFPATSLDVDELAVPSSPMLAAVEQQIRRSQADGPKVLAMIEDSDGSLWVKIQIRQQAYWVVFAPDSFTLPPASAWAGWSLVSLGLALFGGLALMLRVNRPLQALSDAAADIAAGKTPAALPEKGPSEIRTLSRAFNQMSRALSRQESNRAVLLAGVSHDLRTPLSRLRLAIEMVSGRISPAVREGMEHDIEDMDAIISQFLEFAREGAAEAADAAGDLNALVRSLAERYGKRGNDIRLSLDALPALSFKPLAMQRLITNLVDNALRHGNGDVEIATHEENGTVVLCVLDRGPGIPTDAVEKVLQPFTRLNDARTDISGAGLGLAIVDRVARLHGGTVKLLPREGGGLCARVEIPTVPPPSRDAIEEEARVLHESGAGHRRTA